jgi:predicted nucleic acid-binding protein
VSTELWLDSSAILAWYRAEPGHEEVVRVVTSGADGQARVMIAQISLLEIAKAVAEEHGEKAMRDNLRLLHELAIRVEPPTDQQCVEAGLLRTRVRLSTADAIIAIQAMAIDAELVHKDPEFDAVPGLRHRRLPYKSVSKRRP